jgi:transposase
MEKKVTIITERIDDIVLLLNVMMQMGLPTLLNQHLPRHWKQQGLDWGWVATIWLAYILSEGDHRKVMVREWVNQRRCMLEQVCEREISETDFTDDRLAIVLRQLSSEATWQAIEQTLSQNTIRIYALPVQQVRLDATTASGHHLVDEEGLFQYGYSKDDPNLPQIKTMLADLDPLGMPIATQVVSGETADDKLYIPMFDKVRQTLQAIGLLWVGDCKMSALSTRAAINQQQHYYLTPLARVGEVPELLQQWLAEAHTDKTPPVEVSVSEPDGQQRVIATGYERSRLQILTHADGSQTEWTERLLLIHSPAYAQQQLRGLEQRLQSSTAKLLALTPPPKRGQRQILELETLQQKARAILKSHRVEGLLTYSDEYQPPIGRAKGRYQITEVTPNTAAIEQLKLTFGWRVYVTNAPSERLSFADAVFTYRDEWIAERGFHRLKGKSLSLTPLFVQRDDQVKGLVHLLSLGLRILTLIEFVVRRQLQVTGESIVGLHPGKPKQPTTRPTTERLLQAFDNLSLTILEVRGQRYGHVSPLNPLQEKILRLLGLSPEIYLGLVDESSG